MRVDLYPKGGMSGYWEEMEGGGLKRVKGKNKS